ncbi:MAG: rhomboid family intramembrane serine protease [bacterium]|nr:rhomboid family intramembrane serine protease [bacterium]
MFRQIFGNMPDVVKNLLILNILFFLIKYVLEGQGINASQLLGMHYPSSPYFEPFQIVTHFFMHGDLFHLLFNMIGLVVLGSHLERVWGKKRFFIFYLMTALGAMLLHLGFTAYELYELTGSWWPSAYLDGDAIVLENVVDGAGTDAWYIEVYRQVNIPTVGASGAIYGLLMAFALLFPNTEFMLLFPPIPIKAKWLALILGGVALYSGYTRAGGGIAHFAHLGGMLFGYIMIRFWQRNKNTFY